MLKPKKDKTELRRVSPYITMPVQNWMMDNFKNLNAGATHTINSAPALHRQTLIGLKGMFSVGELKLILDVMNATIPTPEWPGATLMGNVPDGIALDGLADKWEIDGDTLIKKIENLHVFQAHTLEIWASAFWYGGDENKKLDIEAYIKPLL